MTRRHGHRADIDRAKGLAIMLVVFGHIVARQPPHDVSWYEPVRRTIYSFHMPFFFYLSGLVSVLAGHVTTPLAGWGDFAAARARRLLLPAAVLGVLVIAGKRIAARFVYVDNVPSGPIAGLIDLVWALILIAAALYPILLPQQFYCGGRAIVRRMARTD